MQRTIYYLFLTFSIGLLVTKLSYGVVTPPNQNFNIDSLKVFYPGEDSNKLDNKYKKNTLLSEKDSDIIYKKYLVEDKNYHFPVFVQIKDGKVLDFFAKLPSYFSHDLYLQSIVNRYGKQNSYHNKNKTSVYKWNLKNNIEIIYSGGCSITCFPIYFTGIIKKSEDDAGEYTPIIKKLTTLETKNLPYQ